MKWQLIKTLFHHGYYIERSNDIQLIESWVIIVLIKCRVQLYFHSGAKYN